MLSSKKRTQFADDVSNGFTQATSTLLYTNPGWLAANPGQIFGGAGWQGFLIQTSTASVYTNPAYDSGQPALPFTRPVLKEIF